MVDTLVLGTGGEVREGSSPSWGTNMINNELDEIIIEHFEQKHQDEMLRLQREHELKMLQIEHEHQLKMKEIEQNHQIEMQKKKMGWLGRLFGCL